MDYETKKLRIVMWILATLLVLSVAGVSLFFITKLRTPSTRFNTVNVGSRITGRGFKSVLTNDMGSWDDVATTDWSGSGTVASPYIINTPEQLAGLSTTVNAGNNCARICFQLGADLDMGGLFFTPIGLNSSKAFLGNIDGCEYTILNLTIANADSSSSKTTYGGLIGYVGSGIGCTVKNLNIEYLLPNIEYNYKYFGGLVGYFSNSIMSVSNINISFNGKYIAPKDSYIGGIAGWMSSGIIENCTTNNFVVSGTFKYVGGIVACNFINGKITNCQATDFVILATDISSDNCSIGGIAGMCDGSITNCSTNVEVNQTRTIYCFMKIGGIVGSTSSKTLLYNNVFDGNITINSPTTYDDIGGLIGYVDSVTSGPTYSIANNLVQGNISINMSNTRPIVGGLFGECKVESTAYDIFFENNIVNAQIETNASATGGIYGKKVSSVTIPSTNIYNSERFTASASTVDAFGATSSANMKLSTTYAEWNNFDNSWIIDENINDGYPMLRSYLGQSKGSTFSGSGTASDPYIIKTRTDMNNLSAFYNYGGALDDVIRYWRLDNDIDMQGEVYEFTPIGASCRFNGSFDGNNHTLSNLKYNSNYKYCGLFGYVKTSGFIKNLNLEIIPFTIYKSSYYGGLAGCIDAIGGNTNINVKYLDGEINCIMNGTDKYIGGMTGSGKRFEGGSVENFNIKIDNDKSNLTIKLSGFSSSGKTVSAKVNANININSSGRNCNYYVAGINREGTTQSMFTGNISVNLAKGSTISECYIAGMSLGVADYSLFQGKITYINNGTLSSSKTPIIAGISASSAVSSYSISNGEINCSGTAKYDVSGTYMADSTSSTSVYSVYNSSKYSPGSNYNKNCTVGATEDSAIKNSGTYTSWRTNFTNNWTISSRVNNGYPIPQVFVEKAAVTGFSGSGTSSSPYFIQNLQDLLGFAQLYNGDKIVASGLYWRLNNNIDISRDLNNMPMHWEPVGYKDAFNGYFEGARYTISGLLIDNQYEYTGLFGTIGANAYVKNLTVKGNVYWDQAYAVGGVAGRVLASGYLQNCRFEGNIIGVLNTKTSTETNGVVGKFEINGAVDCTATYTDLKYAKIGGTTDAPTYTYYLYDWARINTSLYNKKVS